jgi:hypothetical protein
LRQQLSKAEAELKAAETKTGMRLVAGLPGIVVDDTQAQKVGEWKSSTYAQPYVGQGYVHDDRSGKGQKRIIYTPKLPKAGEYEVLISYTTGDSRDTKVPVIIRHSRGETVVHVKPATETQRGRLVPTPGDVPFRGWDKWQRDYFQRRDDGSRDCRRGAIPSRR